MSLLYNIVTLSCKILSLMYVVRSIPRSLTFSFSSSISSSYKRISILFLAFFLIIDCSPFSAFSQYSNCTDNSKLYFYFTVCSIIYFYTDECNHLKFIKNFFNHKFPPSTHYWIEGIHYMYVLTFHLFHKPVPVY